MPAYMVDLDVECSSPGCTKRATVEVRNTWNAPIARYCRRHGTQAVETLNQGS